MGLHVPVSSTKVVGKRKRNEDVAAAASVSHSAVRVNTSKNVAILEQEIYQSKSSLNNILLLQAIAQDEFDDHSHDVPAATALRRAFCHLSTEEDLNQSGTVAGDTATSFKAWQKEQLSAYTALLQRYIRSSLGFQQELGLILQMELIAGLYRSAKLTQPLKSPSLLSQLLQSLLEHDSGEAIHNSFVKAYVDPFADVRLLTFSHIAAALQSPSVSAIGHLTTTNALNLLFKIPFPQFTNAKSHVALFSEIVPQVSDQAKQAQKAWLRLFSQPITTMQRKCILKALQTRVLPWFRRCELLMDFLDDSFRHGGATSLLSLSGLFHMMRERNLDYPNFYTKLYSMIDDSLLHSKWRSQFLRLLSTFLSSSHLPAELVASFVKRLARRSLHGPPGGIVAIIPWIYNMLQTHSTCTLMIHRELRCGEDKQLMELEGCMDPFNMQETDPLRTSASQSCLWELVALQYHYHPNVASLAHIVSEQFTKRSYDLEHFLDYSYTSLLEAEMKKQLKKTPVIEYRVQKHVFTPQGTAEHRLEIEHLI